MKLIGSLTSPYVRKVRIVLAEKRVGHDFEVDVPWDADTRVPDHNPLGKVPVLVSDDGGSVFDSRVIVEYLDQLSPEGRLIPDDPRARIAVRRGEALADGILDAAVAVFLERKRPEAQQNPQWIARQRGKIGAGLQAMARELGEGAWAAGQPSFSLADAASGCALGYLDFRCPELNWREDYPNLARYAERLFQRQSFRDTVPSA